MTNYDEQMKAVARLVSGRPDWIDAPAVQAWHRSDGRTEHDGTPGKPRIWSPDYKTTETWSTPSLRNVHWSDLVDVTPLASMRECPDPEQHDDRYISPLAVKRVKEVQARAEKAERERDEARDAASAAHHAVQEARERFRAAAPQSLTPDAITDEMVLNALVAYHDIAGRQARTVDWTWSQIDSMDRALRAALTEPPARPEGAEEWEGWLIEALPHESMPDEDIARLADQIADRATRRDRRTGPMSIEKTHERCAICDWLGREAERTAKEQGTDHWSSYDGQRDGTEHAAHYLAEVGPTEKETNR